jgi:hypothetical protein
MIAAQAPPSLLTFFRRQLSQALETFDRFLGGSVNLLMIVVIGTSRGPVNKYSVINHSDKYLAQMMISN